MSTNQDTAFDRTPQTDRDAVRGRANPDPNPVYPQDGSNGRRAYRLALIGTPGPLKRISPDPPTALTDRFGDEQSLIGYYTGNSIKALWDSHMDPGNFDASWKDLGPIFKILIAQHFTGSAVNAANFYRSMKVVQGLDYPKIFPAPLIAGHVDNMAGSVANGSFRSNLNNGRGPDAASYTARNTFGGAAARFVLNGARNTVTAAVANDPDASGWERLVEPGACSYCTAQAVKGPFKPGNRGFRAHDNCTCLAVPVFKGDKSGPNSSLREEWNRITGTFTGKDARRAWDQYWRENNGDQEDQGTAGAASG